MEGTTCLNYTRLRVHREGMCVVCAYLSCKWNAWQREAEPELNLPPPPSATFGVLQSKDCPPFKLISSIHALTSLSSPLYCLPQATHPSHLGSAFPPLPVANGWGVQAFHTFPLMAHTWICCREISGAWQGLALCWKELKNKTPPSPHDSPSIGSRNRPVEHVLLSLALNMVFIKGL